MKSKRVLARCLIAFYLLIELAILIVSKLPVLCPYENFVGDLLFLSIVVNLTAALLFRFLYGRGQAAGKDHLILLALLLTTVGDLFLTCIGEPFLTYGVFVFCIVETVYAIWLKSPRFSVILRAILFLLFFAGAILIENVSAMNVFAILNIAILFMNVIDAWTLKNRDTGWMFKFGITLFFCCDISLGMSVLLDGTPGRIFAFLIWMFYIPSQVLLTLRYILGSARSADRTRSSYDLTDGKDCNMIEGE